jgi:hypothetical protein
MRRAIARSAGLLTLVVGITACARQSGAGRPLDVRVTITCPQRMVNVIVQGWVVHGGGRDQVNMQFAQGANVTGITITPKDPARWPFTPAPPYVVQPGGQQTITIDSTAAPGTYSYNIVGTCTPPNGVAQTITIDPDIVVD